MQQFLPCCIQVRQGLKWDVVCVGRSSKTFSLQGTSLLQLLLMAHALGRCLLFVAIAGGGALGEGVVGHDAILDAPSRPCAPGDIVTVAVLSDRLEQMLAVVLSAQASAEDSTCFEWHLFTSDAPRLSQLLDDQTIAADQRHVTIVYSLIDAEIALEKRGITPVWQRASFRAAASGKPRRTPWSLLERASDSDPKHAHPLNLLRFYLADLPAFEGVERLLLLDDDVCVQQDLKEAFFAPSPAGHTSGGPTPDTVPALIASCQMQRFDTSTRRFAIGQGTLTYADTPFLGAVGGPAGYALCPEDEEDDEDASAAEVAALERRRRAGCAPAALEPKLSQMFRQISAQHSARPSNGITARGSESADDVSIDPGGDVSLAAIDPDVAANLAIRNTTAWNYGVALMHLDTWRSRKLLERFDAWCVANEHFGFFAPTSVSFGLGLAYLTLAGQVACWPAGTVLDGLGFLTWADLQANGIGLDEIEVRACARICMPACRTRACGARETPLTILASRPHPHLVLYLPSHILPRVRLFTAPPPFPPYCSRLRSGGVRPPLCGRT